MKNILLITTIFLIPSLASAELGSSNIDNEFVGSVLQVSAAPVTVGGVAAGVASIRAQETLDAERMHLRALNKTTTHESLSQKLQKFDNAEREFIDNEVKDLVKKQAELRRQEKVFVQMLNTADEDMLAAERHLSGMQKLYAVKLTSVPDPSGFTRSLAQRKLHDLEEDVRITKSEHAKLAEKFRLHLISLQDISRKISEARHVAKFKWRETPFGKSTQAGLDLLKKESSLLISQENKVAKAARLRTGLSASSLALFLTGAGMIAKGQVMKDGAIVSSQDFVLKRAPSITDNSLIPTTPITADIAH